MSQVLLLRICHGAAHCLILMAQARTGIATVLLSEGRAAPPARTRSPAPPHRGHYLSRAMQPAAARRSEKKEGTAEVARGAKKFPSPLPELIVLRCVMF